MICALIKGSSIRSVLYRVRHFGRVVHDNLFAFGSIGNKAYVGNGGNNGLVEFPFQPFLDDLHVQHSQEIRNGNQSQAPAMFPVQRLSEASFNCSLSMQSRSSSKSSVFTGKIPANTIGFTSWKPLMISWVGFSCSGDGITHFYFLGIFNTGNDITHIAGLYFFLRL